jgi:hypothetical protein
LLRSLVAVRQGSSSSSKSCEEESSLCSHVLPRSTIKMSRSNRGRASKGVGSRRSSATDSAVGYSVEKHGSCLVDQSTSGSCQSLPLLKHATAAAAARNEASGCASQDAGQGSRRLHSWQSGNNCQKAPGEVFAHDRAAAQASGVRGFSTTGDSRQTNQSTTMENGHGSSRCQGGRSHSIKASEQVRSGPGYIRQYEQVTRGSGGGNSVEDGGPSKSSRRYKSSSSSSRRRRYQRLQEGPERSGGRHQQEPGPGWQLSQWDSNAGLEGVGVTGAAVQRSRVPSVDIDDLLKEEQQRKLAIGGNSSSGSKRTVKLQVGSRYDAGTQVGFDQQSSRLFDGSSCEEVQEGPAAAAATHWARGMKLHWGAWQGGGGGGVMPTGPRCAALCLSPGKSGGGGEGPLAGTWFGSLWVLEVKSFCMLTCRYHNTLYEKPQKHSIWLGIWPPRHGDSNHIIMCCAQGHSGNSWAAC